MQSRLTSIYDAYVPRVVGCLKSNEYLPFRIIPAFSTDTFFVKTMHHLSINKIRSILFALILKLKGQLYLKKTIESFNVFM